MPGRPATPSRLSESAPSAPVPRDEWDSHWEDFGQANERNPAQNFRLRLTTRLLETPAPPRRLLDIGSGNGEFLAVAARRWPNAELMGIELSRSGIAQAERKVPSARFWECDLVAPSPSEAEAEAEAGAPRWASHAICSEVLEHVDDPLALLINARAWLAPGAVVVITVPGGPMSAFDGHIGHRRHFSPADLRALMAAAGFEPQQVWGAGFPIFNLYRGLVIARGPRLIDDARDSSQDKSASNLVRMGMIAFDLLFRLATTRGRRGWQTVGVCRVPVGL
jgi:SAM-dependent methyltransferase